LTDVWAAVPGNTLARETFEAAAFWGPASQYVFTAGNYNSGMIDSGNTPTFEIRPGLVLGQKIADGTWLQYNPTASDGTEVAAAINVFGIRMQDLSGTNQPRFMGIIVGGRVQAARLIGLDNMARQQLRNFIFDDNFTSNAWYPWKRFVTKTASYQVLASDNFTIFDNTGAAGAVTFTLPPIANGYYFGFRGAAAQNLLVTSTEGGNIIALNNLVASTLAFQTGGQIIGGELRIYSNPAGTKWIAENVGAGVAAVTVT
jgi:hypothetical protein